MKNNSAIQFIFEIKLQSVLGMFTTEIKHVFNRIEMHLEFAEHFFSYRHHAKKKKKKLACEC